MKSYNNIIQFKPHPRTAPLNRAGSKGDEKGFNPSPFQGRGKRRTENIVQGFLVPSVHPFLIKFPFPMDFTQSQADYALL